MIEREKLTIGACVAQIVHRLDVCIESPDVLAFSGAAVTTAGRTFERCV